MWGLRIMGVVLRRVSQRACFAKDYYRIHQNRPSLSDQDFIAKFYSESQVPPEIPLRTRRVFARQLLCDRIIPQDNVWEIFDDIPFDEIMADIAEEFGVQIDNDEIGQIDGTFDAIVKLMATKYCKTICDHEAHD